MYWLVSLPLDEPQDRIWSRLQSKTVYESDLAQSYRFEMPELRVGTLDALMVLSDDLVKVTVCVTIICKRCLVELFACCTQGF